MTQGGNQSRGEGGGVEVGWGEIGFCSFSYFLFLGLMANFALVYSLAVSRLRYGGISLDNS